MQFGERCLGVGTRYVAQHNARDQLTINRHIRRHFVRLKQPKSCAQVILRPTGNSLADRQESILPGGRERQPANAHRVAVHLAGNAFAGVFIDVLDDRILPSMAGPAGLRLGA